MLESSLCVGDGFVGDFIFYFIFFKSQRNRWFQHLLVGEGAGYYTKPAVYLSIYWLHNSSLQPAHLKISPIYC